MKNKYTKKQLLDLRYSLDDTKDAELINFIDKKLEKFNVMVWNIDEKTCLSYVSNNGNTLSDCPAFMTSEQFKKKLS